MGFLFRYSVLTSLLILTSAPVLLMGQQASTDGSTAVRQPGSTDPTEYKESRRIFWIIPNYRSSPSLANYTPLTPKQKFKIAFGDAADPGTVALAALFAG